MKFTTNKCKIQNVLALMLPLLEKKDDSAITSHIYLEVIDNKLIVKATDYEIGLQVIIDVITDIEVGKATVNGSDLLNVIKRLRNEDINFQIENNNLSIKQNKSLFKLPMYNANEYPNFPLMENLNSLDINTINLINSIKNITPVIDNNNPKYELNGALLDIKDDKINFVATDTKRLAVSYLENISNKSMQIIIPKKAIIEIQKIFFDEIKISYDDVNLILSNNNYTFYTKLINGNFPDYTRIIPTSLKYNFSLSKSLLVDSIKLITSLRPNIKITFNSTNILFESVDEDSEAKTQIDINLDIQDTFYIAVNSKYLLDFLSSTNHENINIGFNDSNLPFCLEDDKFKTIIMPIILDK
jgi:DNA polymerase-3 subunit beta